jgi:hypothetical protein
MTREHSPPAWLLLHMPATNIDSILLFTSFHPAGLFLSGHLVVVISFDRTTQQENMLQRFLFLAFSSSTPVISGSEGGTLFRSLPTCAHACVWTIVWAGLLFLESKRAEHQSTHLNNIPSIPTRLDSGRQTRWSRLNEMTFFLNPEYIHRE